MNIEDDLHIRQIGENEEAPMVLLTLADPSDQRIRSYLKQSDCYLAELTGEIIGVYVAGKISRDTIEIYNIAVKEAFQGKGIGKHLLMDAVNRYSKAGYKAIEIGTGNSSIGQLALYQKAGFRIDCILRDFFTDYYEDHIYENGIWCRDMIRLNRTL
ncbi:GNAT family N-acetyltransferase [Salinicoccus hispanicus]|uniref:GNAT family N-acetyltransferase n=1 Tax=Salinicoccus hispanicus TaxID=157225 RepID=A0A6N8U3L8_9STAP|nr:GNAT family N-acetyltransferase [Salinicoccus hispanicus]MXQ51917.1 GNAT family N-acetyltransferase [Salinicoccus hispanicus]